jgi:hypothetical protein
MSLPETGKVLHKSGKELPLAPDRDQRAHYAEAVARSLRQVLEAPGISTKTIMGWTSASERTVKGWIAGTNGPRGEHLIGLIRSSDVVMLRVLSLAGREVLDAHQLAALRDPLRRISELLDSLSSP